MVIIDPNQERNGNQNSNDNSHLNLENLAEQYHKTRLSTGEEIQTMNSEQLVDLYFKLNGIESIRKRNRISARNSRKAADYIDDVIGNDGIPEDVDKKAKLISKIIGACMDKWLQENDYGKIQSITEKHVSAYMQTTGIGNFIGNEGYESNIKGLINYICDNENDLNTASESNQIMRFLQSSIARSKEETDLSEDLSKVRDALTRDRRHYNVLTRKVSEFTKQSYNANITTPATLLKEFDAEVMNKARYVQKSFFANE